MNQKIVKLCTGKHKNLLIGALMLVSFFILLPSFIFVVQNQMAPYTDHEVVITTVSYESEGLEGRQDNVISGLLFQPAPKFSDKKYPAIIACHGWLFDIGKETMNRWCVELAKRGFVVLSIDLPGNGMTIGEMDLFPRVDLEPQIIKDGLRFLKGYSFVDDKSLGLVGISYGATTVAITAGKLGTYIGATFAINGFYSATEWLVEDVFLDNKVEFSVHQDYIEIEKIDDREVTKDNIKDFLKLYTIIRGNDEIMEDLIIDETNRLDRDFLKKFDAIEYLPNVRNNSIMFLHSIRDKEFGDISKQAYKTVKSVNKTAYYTEVDDIHELLDDPEYTSDFIMINFFEEKLKGVDLGDDFDDDFDKYSQERDIELTYSKVFTIATAFYLLASFILSLIPFLIILTIIFYNKKVSINRAKKEAEALDKKVTDKNFIDFTFGRGSYWKTIVLLSCSYFIAYLAIMGGSLGLLSELAMGVLCAAFYFMMFLILYFLPDKAEVNLWSIRRKKLLQTESNVGQDQFKESVNPLNKKFVLLLTMIVVIASGIVGLLFTFFTNFYYHPFELVFRSMMAMGIVLLVGGIVLAFLFEKRKNDQTKFGNISWERYGLDKYSTIRGITFGSVLFLNFFFEWNIWVYYLKFPMPMGPHSIYYLYMALAVVLFFGGFQVILKIFKENALKGVQQNASPTTERKGKFKKILIEVESTVFGCFLLAVGVYLAFYLYFYSEIFGNFSHLIVLFVLVVYLITNIFKIINIDRSIFGISVFVPLLLFCILAYLLHI